MCTRLCRWAALRGNATLYPTPATKQLAQRPSHVPELYTEVFGPGKRRMRGLWKRGEIQFNVITPATLFAYQEKRSADGTGARTDQS